MDEKYYNRKIIEEYLLYIPSMLIMVSAVIALSTFAILTAIGVGTTPAICEWFWNDKEFCENVPIFAKITAWLLLGLATMIVIGFGSVGIFLITSIFRSSIDSHRYSRELVRERNK